MTNIELRAKAQSAVLVEIDRRASQERLSDAARSECVRKRLEELGLAYSPEDILRVRAEIDYYLAIACSNNAIEGYPVSAAGMEEVRRRAYICAGLPAL